jgi:D-inositol-3-phosphate glycosyltransferase
MIHKLKNKQDQLKVAIIEPVGGHGGMDYYDFGLCSGLVAAGIMPSLYTSTQTALDSKNNFSVFPMYKNIFGSLPKWRRGLNFVSSSFKVFKHCRSFGNTIAHFHFFHIGILEYLNIALAKIFCMKIIITAHDIESFVNKKEFLSLGRLCYRSADIIITHNKWSHDALKKRFKIKSCNIIPHGNYIKSIKEVISTQNAREKLKIGKKKKVLLFFGQIKKVKGLDILLRSLPFVKEKHPEILLLIAGKVWQDNFEIYRSIIRQYNLQNCCHLNIQYIPNDQVQYYYSAADLVVLPYRRIYQSGVLLMAMSYQKAVLASDLPGMTDIVENKKTGFTFKTGSATNLAQIIIEILANPELSKKVANAGFDQVKNKFKWDIIGKLTAQCYKSRINHDNR